MNESYRLGWFFIDNGSSHSKNLWRHITRSFPLKFQQITACINLVSDYKAILQIRRKSLNIEIKNSSIHLIANPVLHKVLCLLLQLQLVRTTIRNKTEIKLISMAVEQCKCPNTEFFLVRVFPHSDWIRIDFCEPDIYLLIFLILFLKNISFLILVRFMKLTIRFPIHT